MTNGILIAIILVLVLVVAVVSHYRPRPDVRPNVAKTMIDENQRQAIAYFLYALAGHRPNQLWGLITVLAEAPLRVLCQEFEVLAREQGHGVVLQRPAEVKAIREMVKTLADTPDLLRICIDHAATIKGAFSLTQDPAFRSKGEVYFGKEELNPKTISYITEKSNQI